MHLRRCVEVSCDSFLAQIQKSSRTHLHKQNSLTQSVYPEIRRYRPQNRSKNGKHSLQFLAQIQNPAELTYTKCVPRDASISSEIEAKRSKHTGHRQILGVHILRTWVMSTPCESGHYPLISAEIDRTPHTHFAYLRCVGFPAQAPSQFLTRL